MTSLQSAPQSLVKSAVVSPVLGFGMAFADLYRRDGLVRLDQAFLNFLQEGEPVLRARLDHARSDPDSLDRKAESALLIEIENAMFDRTQAATNELFGAAQHHARHHEV